MSMNDTLNPLPLMPVMEGPLQTKSVKVDTPFGGIESDSGSHTIDILTIVLVIVALYVGKKLVDRYIR